MSSAQNALNKKRNEKLLKQFFKPVNKSGNNAGNRIVGNGRVNVELGESKSGPCKFCRAQAGRHNIKANGVKVPAHPNCKCSLH